MSAFCSLFRQILDTFPRGEFEQLIARHRSERHARGFTSWQQLVAMLFCHLGRAQSLREIEHGLRSAEGKLSHLGIDVPKRSTLSYANAHRPWQLFESVYYALYERCRQVSPGKRFRFKNRLLSIDSTTVEVVSQMYDWATHNKCKGAIKLHLMLDHEGMLPVFATVTDGNGSDVAIGREMPLPAGAVVVFDRGYIDYEWFRRLDEQGVFIVTRLKKNCHWEPVDERDPVRGIVSDQIVHVVHKDMRRRRPRSYQPLRLRRVEVALDDGQTFVLFTNNFRLGATTISRIYKDRWQIELFFKALKQNLKIKTFIGTSANAIHIQLWTALIAMLLVRYLKAKSQCSVSLSNVFAMLRFHLFAHRDLSQWLKQPFDPMPPPAAQLSLL